MKRMTIGAVLALCVMAMTVPLKAQTMQEVIEAQANEMISGMQDGVINKLLDHTLPAVLDLGGGRVAMKEAITAMLTQTEELGFSIDTVYVGKAGEIYEAGTELHAIIPQYLKLGFAEGYIESMTYLVAVSKDQGKWWYFIDVKQIDEDMKNMVLPVMNEDMVIPEPEKAKQVFYEDEE